MVALIGSDWGAFDANGHLQLPLARSVQGNIQQDGKIKLLINLIACNSATALPGCMSRPCHVLG